MRVLHFSTAHRPDDMRIVFKHARSADARGIDVTVATPYEARTTVGSVRFVRHGAGPAFGSRLLQGRSELRRLVSECDPDLIMLHDVDGLLHLGALVELGKQVVFDMHEDLPALLRQRDWVPGVLRPFMSRAGKVAERIALRRVPTLLAEDGYLVDREWIERKLVVRNYPILSELEPIRLRAARSSRSMVYCGAVTEARGALEMVEVANTLASDGQVELDIIGEVEEGLRKRLVARGSLGRVSVRVHGRLPFHEAMPLVARASVGLSLLHPLPNYQHSLPTKLLEYFALGTVPVASTSPVVDEVMRAVGLGESVNPYSISEVAEAVRRAWAVNAEMRAAAASRVMSLYSWENEESVLWDFLSKLK